MSDTADGTAEVFVEYGSIGPNVVYGRTCDGDLKRDVYKPRTKSAKLRPALIRLVSPLTYVGAGNPPVITIHSDADPLVPYALSARLCQSGC